MQNHGKRLDELGENGGGLTPAEANDILASRRPTQQGTDQSVGELNDRLKARTIPPMHKARTGPEELKGW